MVLFESTDFTAMPRNCENMTCVISSKHNSLHKLACVLYLPPCATHIYYLEWKGKCHNDLPDFVFFNNNTSERTILDSFVFKQQPISQDTTIHFVQLVLGPSSNLSFACNYNHIDNCLELLPDGPSRLLPTVLWKSSVIQKSLVTSRSHNKLSLNNFVNHTDHTRLKALQKLPESANMFRYVRKRSNNPIIAQFASGKTVRNDLPLLHVHVKASALLRTCASHKNFFAVPFLGDKIGLFGNVDLQTMKQLNDLFRNGMTIDEHNLVLQKVSQSVTEYQICDNEQLPIIVTFKDVPCKHHTVDLSVNTYGQVMDMCEGEGAILQSFLFYCQYCHPFIVTEKHKDFIKNAVGIGSGNRHCSKLPPGITNLYYGSRSFPTLAQSSPIVGPQMPPFHNNYRREWNSVMLASILQMVNSLTHRIHHISRWANPKIEFACHNGSEDINRTELDMQLCRTTIITCADNEKYLGFVNTSHVDRKDLYKKSIQKDLTSYCNQLPNGPTKNYVTSTLKVGVGKPTTCGYQFVNHTDANTEGTIFQFFLFDGLGIGLRIHDFACHMFYGHYAFHRTALPLLVRDDKVFYTDSKLGVFAWGKS